MSAPRAAALKTASNLGSTAWRLSLAAAAVFVVAKLAKLLLLLFVIEQRPWRTAGWLAKVITSSGMFKLAVAGVIGLWLWRKLFGPRRSWLFFPAAVAAFMALKLVHGLASGGGVNVADSVIVSSTLGELRFFVALFHQDVAFAAMWLALLLLALRVVGGAARTLPALASTAATAIVVSLVALDLAYFSRTGHNGTAHLLEYLVRNLQALAPAVGAETTPLAIASFLLCVLVFVTCVKTASVAPARYPPAWVALPLLVLAVLLVGPFGPRAQGDALYARLTRNPIVGLARDLMGTPDGQALVEANAEMTSNRGLPRWHSSGLNLQPGPNAKTYNIVLIMLESARADATSLYGRQIATTPFLSRLAEQSIVVEDMYAVIPRTASAWLGVLYGLYPFEDIPMRPWADRQATRPTVKSLPEMLRPLGYASAFFVPAHLDVDNERQLLEVMRFDKLISDRDIASPPGAWRNYLGFADEVLLKPIHDWVAPHVRESRPFLLTVMTNVGHHDYQPPPSWPRQVFDQRNARRNDYLNCMAYIDRHVENLYTMLSDLGVADSTIFVVVGDHGEPFGEHGGTISVRVLYEESLRVPAIVHAPQTRSAPGRVKGHRQQVDLIPTLVDLLGYDVRDASLPGISLFDPVPADRTLYFGSNIEESFLARRKGAAKHIYFYGRAPVEHYDLDGDAAETKPIAEPDEAVDKVTADMLLWRQRSRLTWIAAPAR